MMMMMLLTELTEDEQGPAQRKLDSRQSPALARDAAPLAVCTTTA